MRSRFLHDFGDRVHRIIVARPAEKRQTAGQGQQPAFAFYAKRRTRATYRNGEAAINIQVIDFIDGFFGDAKRLSADQILGMGNGQIRYFYNV